jgi:hypothetical protein
MDGAAKLVSVRRSGSAHLAGSAAWDLASVLDNAGHYAAADLAYALADRLLRRESDPTSEAMRRTDRDRGLLARGDAAGCLELLGDVCSLPAADRAC